MGAFIYFFKIGAIKLVWRKMFNFFWNSIYYQPELQIIQNLPLDSLNKFAILFTEIHFYKYPTLSLRSTQTKLIPESTI
jgi:hypothetical protein